MDIDDGESKENGEPSKARPLTPEPRRSPRKVSHDKGSNGVEATNGEGGPEALSEEPSTEVVEKVGQTEEAVDLEAKRLKKKKKKKEKKEKEKQEKEAKEQGAGKKKEGKEKEKGATKRKRGAEEEEKEGKKPKTGVVGKKTGLGNKAVGEKALKRLKVTEVVAIPASDAAVGGRVQQPARVPPAPLIRVAAGQARIVANVPTGAPASFGAVEAVPALVQVDVSSVSRGVPVKSVVSLWKSGEEAWHDELVGSRVVLACAAQGGFVACCAVEEEREGSSGGGCGRLYVYSTNSGRRLLPCLALPALPACMTASGQFVAVVATDGSLYVWDIPARKLSLRASVLTLLVRGAGTTIADLRLDRDGQPLVSLSNRKLYQFDDDLMVWIRLSDEFFPGSFFPNSLQPSLLSPGSLQSASVKEALSRLPVAGPAASYQEQTRASVTHLEDQVACALSLGQAQTYQHCLCAYVRKLVHLCSSQGMNETPFAWAPARVKEVVLELMGPMQASREGEDGAAGEDARDGWRPLVLGLPKREMLRRLLPELAACPALQRLAERLNHAFHVLEESSSS
jgi:hypothetical protein